MYLPIETQPDCASAWLAAVSEVDRQQGHTAHNVLIDIEDPTARADVSDPIVANVENFLRQHDRPSVKTVANTIFPQPLYRRHGSPDFFDAFHERVLPKVRRNRRWTGYYFERLTAYPLQNGESFNQLQDVVERMRNPNNPSRNTFEVSLFDPERDIDNSRYGGQCLSFMSFKLVGQDRRVNLTAMYRNHYYIEKLMGNIIGLGRVVDFVARETGLPTGSLTILSTHAQIDQPGRSTRSEICELLADAH